MRRITLLLLSALLLCTATVQAQTDLWSVWLFDAERGQAIEVDQSGAILNDLILPVPAPYVDYQIVPNIAVSPDGNRIAYAVSGTNANDQPLSAFLVFDTTLGRVLFTYEPPQYATVTSLLFSEVTWNSTGNILAYSYAAGDTLETQTWRVVVLNAIDGRIISELDDAAPFFSQQTEQLAPYLLPVLQYYGEATLGFTLVPYQTMSFAAELFSYEWDIVTGRVIQNNRAPRITGDTLQPTGETITPVTDDRANYDASFAPYTNAIHVFRPEIGARAPFFATRTYDILSAQFIQNGEQVLVYAEDLLSFQRTHLVVNRIGILRPLPGLNAINNAMIGVPDGFAYVINNPTPVLVWVNTRDQSFPQSPIWTAPENSSFVPMWGTTFEAASYDAWLQLAPPIFPAQVVVTEDDPQGVAPDAVPTTESFTGSRIITVDSVAVVNTTDGDRLNMRDAPALNSNVIARVDSGTRVVILEGPVAQDGFTWWEVRLPTGQTGWMVERAEGVQTLLPAG